MRGVAAAMVSDDVRKADRVGGGEAAAVEVVPSAGGAASAEVAA
jgi:hypothetical protein